MDYADGGDLSMKIKEQNGKLFSENEILNWFTQVCLAIKHIHDRKILHRDIKSQNIFLMKDGRVKLGDFGIAKCLNQTIDKAKTYVGTPYYLSPEIINSQPYDFKSDIWSLGVLLYEICALKMPFDASNLPQLYIKIITCKYPPLSNKYSKELHLLVKSMLNETSIKRPNIKQILDVPIIKSRIGNFLNDKEYAKEFSHTVLHNFNLSSSHSDEKMTKNELVSNNNINNNNISSNYMNNNYMNKIRISQGHSRPIVKKDFNDKYDKNLRISGNDISNQQQNINYLRKNLDPKVRESNTKSNRHGIGKYNGNNNIFNYGNNNMNNNRGLFEIKEGKDYKRNDTGRNKKGKIIGREEFSSDKIGKNIQNNKNNMNNNENIYNGLRSENSSKYNNSNKKRMNNDKKNIVINNSNVKKGNNISNIDKERRQNLKEFKRKYRRENKNNKINQDGVEWMSGMENYREKKEDNNVENLNTNISDNQTNTNDITESNNNMYEYEDLSSKSNKKEINGKNLLPLDDISNINLNNFSNDYMNEEEINSNNKLYEDVMKEDNNNLNYIENENNNNGKNTNYSDLLNSNLTENINYENSLEINGDKVSEDIWKDIINDFGKEISQNISKIIKKYINDDMISYDFSKITDNIVKDLKYKNISKSLIEKAINKIPDIYYLILCNKL